MALVPLWWSQQHLNRESQISQHHRGPLGHNRREGSSIINQGLDRDDEMRPPAACRRPRRPGESPSIFGASSVLQSCSPWEEPSSRGPEKCSKTVTCIATIHLEHDRMRPDVRALLANQTLMLCPITLLISLKMTSTGGAHRLHPDRRGPRHDPSPEAQSRPRHPCSPHPANSPLALPAPTNTTAMTTTASRGRAGAASTLPPGSHHLGTLKATPSASTRTWRSAGAVILEPCTGCRTCAERVSNAVAIRTIRTGRFAPVPERDDFFHAEFELNRSCMLECVGRGRGGGWGGTRPLILDLDAWIRGFFRR